MTDEKEFEINSSAFQWCLRFLDVIEKRLGLNIKLHHDDGLLEKGHIFLFNHFARFETIIPPYIIYKETGAYCRSVADHALFDTSEGFGKFLKGVGAVPNDIQGLLPFLAAEILRGRKVVIFPEGGMVKDRRVIDSEGEYNVYSRSSKERRKHHRGAAVLAHTLDVLKSRILDLDERSDLERINRWVEALGLRNAEELLEKAREPTVIVPATITFYPIRVRENIVSRALELFTKDLPRQFTEEMMIEGNLLFRNTDMDIRIGDPIELRKKWSRWEKLLINRYFLKIRSLNDLFGLKDHATMWAERLLARSIEKESLRIRDTYMEALYTGITVNLSHLASRIITLLIDRGRMEISLDEFHRALYLSLKNLQAAPGINLHRSLLWPDRYQGLLDGDCPELDRFLLVCKEAGLVGRTPSSYRFLDKLCEEHGFDEVRLENPVMVYANEVAPIRGVRETVDAALKKALNVSEQELASFLFDDELRAYDWNYKHFAGPEYTYISKLETATKSGEPHLLLPEEHVSTGVLLVHGFLSAPAEMRDFGEKLCASGYAAMAVRLAGHGTSPCDLRERTWPEWLSSVRRGYRILSAFVDHVVIVGFSTGADLALMLAAENPAKLTGIAALAPPLDFHDRKMLIVPLVHGINKLSSMLPSVDGVMPYHENISEHPEINYRSIPVQGLYELRAMIDEMKSMLPKVRVPVTVIQADNDPVVVPEGAKEIFGMLTGSGNSFHWVKADRHGILMEDIGGTQRLVEEFIERMAVEMGGAGNETGDAA